MVVVLETISTIVSVVAVFTMIKRLRKRRREVRQMEQILDQQGLHYKPSSMYRRKRWFHRGTVRKYSGDAEGKDWSEYKN